MTRDDIGHIIRAGASQWNEWRKSHGTDLFGPSMFPIPHDLSGLDLRGIDLSNMVLHETRFAGADLRGALFSKSIIEYVDFSGVDFREASFNRTRLDFVNLQGADLHRAKLRDCTFHRTQLANARLAGAIVAGIAWCEVDLTSALGVADVVHEGPSTLGLDTLYLSRGGIPEEFLRGSGVPDNLIDLQKSLVQGATPIQFYSCFISYCHLDEDFARRLHGRLRQEGLRVWFAPEEMKGGRKLVEQVDEAIRMHDKLLLVLSDASMRSEWVATEISKARRREQKEGKRVLFPIRLVEFDAIQEWESFDADIGKDSAREVREYFIPDFSRWKDHDAFEESFGGLLRALRSSG